jgi:hypothetical protein
MGQGFPPAQKSKKFAGIQKEFVDADQK